MTMIKIQVLTLLALLVFGCSQNCMEPVRMGDFEMSQGNYPNAIRHYERALAIDPECARVDEKLQDARARLELLQRQNPESQ